MATSKMPMIRVIRMSKGAALLACSHVVETRRKVMPERLPCEECLAYHKTTSKQPSIVEMLGIQTKKGRKHGHAAA